MLFEPTLNIREVAIYKGTSYAYRASFHRGVNIIRGENSSGKSTILSLIVYGLGADMAHWSEHAKLCDRVSIEVLLNGNVATLSRLISPQLGQPMEIFPGSLAEAETAPISAWKRYPYRTSPTRESFSQAIFHFLNVPELETETTGKITLHQLLRLHYSDQLSPVEKIFRQDSFDSPALREAVGRLVFGAYESEIYVNQLRIREIEKELSSIEAALKSIYVLLGGLQHSLTLEWIESERRNIKLELTKVAEQTLLAETKAYDDEAAGSISLTPQAQAYERARELQLELASIEDEEASLQLEYADTEIFILTLNRKIESLRDSSAVAEEISGVTYTSCPSCLAIIEEHNNPYSCHLCKSPFDEEKLRKRIINQLNDLLIQVKQSIRLQAGRAEELAELRRKREQVRRSWDVARDELARIRRSPTSEAREALRSLSERAGYLQRELEGLNEKASLIERLDVMAKEKSRLSASLAELTDINTRLKYSEAERLSKAYGAVAQETIYFLRHDLPRQDTFQTSSDLVFSFSKDNITVDGQSYFSASSTVYLKNAFLSALLFSAARDPQFRHLRLTILDTIEDKGMEPERSQNFQRLLVDRSASIDADHQLIFATAMINPELDTEEYVVGRSSTHQHRTLDI